MISWPKTVSQRRGVALAETSADSSCGCPPRPYPACSSYAVKQVEEVRHNLRLLD